MEQIIFAQGAGDGKEHTLYVDDIRIENGTHTSHIPTAPKLIEAKGYERHVDLKWEAAPDPTVAQYVIYRSMNGEPFRPIGVQRYGVNRFSDFLGDPHAAASYKISARTSSLGESQLSAVVTASTHPMTDEDLLTMVQELRSDTTGRLQNLIRAWLEKTLREMTISSRSVRAASALWRSVVAADRGLFLAIR